MKKNCTSLKKAKSHSKVSPVLPLLIIQQLPTQSYHQLLRHQQHSWPKEQLMTPPIPQVIPHNATIIYNPIMQKIMLIIMSLIYYHPTLIIQKILQYHPMHKQTHHPILTNHQQWHQHQLPTITMEPTTYSYRLIWQYLNVTFFKSHRHPTSTSDVQGSSLATAWRNQRPTLHQHKPPKQGRSLASVVSQQSPTLRN